MANGSMNQSMDGSWITGNLHGAQAPSGSIRLRRAPSGFEGPRTSAHTHPQSTLHRPSRIATLVRTALGLVVRCGMTMPMPRRAAAILYAHNGGSGLGGRDASTYTVVAQAMLVCAGAGNYNVHRPVLSRHEAGTIRVVTAPRGTIGS